MASTALPDNVEELKAIVTSLQEENKRLRHQLFGHKSEKLSAEDINQSYLFDEIEDQISSDNITEAGNNDVEVKSYNRKKPGRKPYPEGLPVIDVIQDLPENEKTCQCGTALKRIGQETADRLDIIPQKLQIKRQIRYKYARICQCVDEENIPSVITAPKPKQIIEKGMVTSGFLAFIITSKFVDHLPFYRLEKILARMGIEIGRATMCNWAIKIHQRCRRLLILLAKEARSGPLIAVDETSVQVLKERGRLPTQKSFMWVACGGIPGKPVILCRYRRHRSAKFLGRYLKGYDGILQSDGYRSYNNLAARLDLNHAGCWAHVRRKFFELSKISKRAKVANIALKIIQKLYAVEAEADEGNFTFEQRLKLRQKKSRPIVEEFKAFLDSKSGVIRNSPMGKAVEYANKEWLKLLVFLEDGRVPIDNNRVENAIRPFVVGRKNWLFSDSTRGARASSAFYSLIETAKANGLEPYWYLRYLFGNLPDAELDEELVQLLPTRLSPDQIMPKITV